MSPTTYSTIYYNTSSEYIVHVRIISKKHLLLVVRCVGTYIMSKGHTLNFEFSDYVFQELQFTLRWWSTRI